LAVLIVVSRNFRQFLYIYQDSNLSQIWSTRICPRPFPVTSFEIISLQTTRKENDWKTEETLAGVVVTLETERIKGSNPWCLWWWPWWWSWSFTTSYSPIAPTSDFEVIWVTRSCLSSVKTKWTKGVFGEVYKVGLHVSCGVPVPSRYTACPKSRCTRIVTQFKHKCVHFRSVHFY